MEMSGEIMMRKEILSGFGRGRSGKEEIDQPNDDKGTFREGRSVMRKEFFQHSWQLTRVNIQLNEGAELGQCLDIALQVS